MHRYAGIVRQVQAVCVFAALASTALPALAQENGVDGFRNALINYFLPLNYVPVLVNRGYAVGDVIDVDGVDFSARARQCFPELKPPAPVASSLEDAVQSSSAGVSFGLKLRQIFDSTAGADLERRFRITFSDVTVIAVSRAELKEALDRKACPEIAPLVDGTATPLDRSRKPYFVVSEVIYGKRNAILEFIDKANVQAKADRLARQVGDASLKLQAANHGSVIVKSDVVLPIALKPVTVPKVIGIADLNGVRSEPEYRLDWLECPKNRPCTTLFASFVDLVKASKPRLTERDLNQ
jgi:hypothetical protein